MGKAAITASAFYDQRLWRKRKSPYISLGVQAGNSRVPRKEQYQASAPFRWSTVLVRFLGQTTWESRRQSLHIAGTLDQLKQLGHEVPTTLSSKCTFIEIESGK
jgi:hypothetical protein